MNVWRWQRQRIELRSRYQLNVLSALMQLVGWLDSISMHTNSLLCTRCANLNTQNVRISIVVSLHLCSFSSSSSFLCNNETSNNNTRIEKTLHFQSMYNLILKPSEYIKYLRAYRSLLNANIVKIICKRICARLTHTHTLKGFLLDAFGFRRVHTPVMNA